MILYHVTSWIDKEKILREGLVPEEQYYEPEIKAVFLWGTFRDALKYLNYLSEHEEEFGPYVIFRVNLPEDVKYTKRMPSSRVWL